MLTIGYRGLGSGYPGNTLPAVRGAANHVDVVEIDVRRCGSDELVVVHDDDPERLTGHEGSVSGSDLTTLGRLTVGDSDARIPTLVEVLREWPEGVGLDVDVKGPTAVDRVVRRLDDTSVDGPIIVSARRELLEPFDPVDRCVRLGLSVERDPGENVRYAAARGCDFVHVHHRLRLETDVDRPRTRCRARRRHVVARRPANRRAARGARRRRGHRRFTRRSRMIRRSRAVPLAGPGGTETCCGSAPGSRRGRGRGTRSRTTPGDRDGDHTH